MADAVTYLEAVVRARIAVRRFSVDSLAGVARVVRDWLEELQRAVVAAEKRGLALREQEAVARLAAGLERLVSEGREQTFDKVLDVWRSVQRSVWSGHGAGLVRLPPATTLGFWEILHPGGTWRTLIRQHALRAGQEAEAVISAGLARGLSPVEVARGLRPYVLGAERLTKEQLADLRTVPRELRGAARQVQHNASRIAFSEMHSARAEAELQHFIEDPLVAGVRWTLAPDRGSGRVPDECDLLAGVDWYGLGAGVFPVRRVPPNPHPWDRCERVPVVRRWGERDQLKPDGPLLVDGPHRIELPKGLTAAAGDAIANRAWRAAQLGRNAADHLPGSMHVVFRG